MLMDFVPTILQLHQPQNKTFHGWLSENSIGLSLGSLPNRLRCRRQPS
jgi:hypothetical protein